MFRVLLPASTQSGAALATLPSPTPPSIRRVLVVDDEPAPRETAARLLRSSGFDVVVASNLKEARQHIADPELALDALKPFTRQELRFHCLLRGFSYDNSR